MVSSSALIALAIPLLCGDFPEMPTLKTNPAPVAEADLGQRLERLIEEARTDFRGLLGPSGPAYPGIDLLSGERYSARFKVWGNHNCYVYPDASGWAFWCAFGFTSDQVLADERYRALKSDLQKVLPTLNGVVFFEQSILLSNRPERCKRRVFGASDPKTRIEVSLHSDPIDCGLPAAVNFVVKHRRWATPHVKPNYDAELLRPPAKIGN